MNVFWHFFVFAAGLALIIKGGGWFVGAAVRIARYLRMPRVVIGTTLVSLTTTLPELTVSIISGLEGQSGLAVGNAVGSCICNIGLILGVTATGAALRVDFMELRFPLLTMVACGIGLVALTLDLRLSRPEGLLLIALGLGYFIFDFISSYRAREPEAKTDAGKLAEAVARIPPWIETRLGTAFQFVGAALLVILGSRLLVLGAVGTAQIIGIPPIFIGLSLVAVGTSIPEFVTALASSRKGVSDLSLGNVVGANIANLTFVIGTGAVLTDVTMDRETQLFSFPAMLLIMALLIWFVRSEERLSRREGAILLLYYALYLGSLGIMTTMARHPRYGDPAAP